ncbi:MBL fold metallo-hydrolase [Cellulomonas fengjieae]|uniref:MBL fold metallo-hydrolase n=1 Tax=Cellulomonas fengjieae TaxID=2819978 RepID=UPI001AB006CA|nr:MBL fold metallo-hydrolase [Cellulomonas fengjieae]MBO3103681.1 MBL fold metallo-hydrolase [Cellulomonas fengjieae]
MVADHGTCLVVDPAVTAREVDALAAAIRDRGWTPVAVWSTHAHWDHVLDGPGLAHLPRWAAAAPATDRETLAAERDTDPELAASGERPAPIAAAATPFPRRTATVLDWAGPTVHVLTHTAHARPHTALVLPEAGVLLAGDMLSDVEVPLLDLAAADPVGDYLAALTLLESADARTVVPGHGHVGRGAEVGRRLDADRAYLAALTSGTDLADPRCALPWVAAAHAAQRATVRGQGAEG